MSNVRSTRPEISDSIRILNQVFRFRLENPARKIPDRLKLKNISFGKIAQEVDLAKSHRKTHQPLKSRENHSKIFKSRFVGSDTKQTFFIFSRFSKFTKFSSSYVFRLIQIRLSKFNQLFYHQDSVNIDKKY